jgi:hypothetical protein
VAVGDAAPAAFEHAFRRRGWITIRRAGPGDAGALDRLGALTDRRPLGGEVLVAEADGDVIAAVSVASGEVQSDPFQPTADVIALLGLRAEQLRRLAA